MRSGPSEPHSLAPTRETPPVTSQFEILSNKAMKSAAKTIQENFAKLPEEFRPAGGKDRLGPAIDAKNIELQSKWTECQQLNPADKGNEWGTNHWDIKVGETVHLRAQVSALVKTANSIKAAQNVLVSLGELKAGDRDAWVRKHIQDRIREDLDSFMVGNMALAFPLLAALVKPEYLPQDIPNEKILKHAGSFKPLDDSTLNGILNITIQEGLLPASTTLAQVKSAIS